MSYTSAVHFDPPEVLDASVTPIPASSSPPMQIKASSGPSNIRKFQNADTTGRFIGIYAGPVGKEWLACIVGNGNGSIVFCEIPSETRISVRSMDSSAINTGFLTGSFII